LTSSLSSPWNPQRSALDPLLFSKGSAPNKDLGRLWLNFQKN